VNRIAVGIEYHGSAFAGWQTQEKLRTVQGELEAALGAVADHKVDLIGAGRTDAGVHAREQVAHFETQAARSMRAWTLGANTHLPADISVTWALPVPAHFHARYCAQARTYRYLILNRGVRSALVGDRAAAIFKPLDQERMSQAAARLLGEHDFSALRSSECQAASPVRTIRAVEITRRGAYWRFEFDANAFLHHMVRNIVGCLVMVGTGARSPAWLDQVVQSKDRKQAAPTFAPDGLYFAGPYYDAPHAIPERSPAADWLP